MSSNENLPPMVIMKLMREIQQLATSPPEGISVYFSEDNITNLHADIIGPEDTPFEGGVFRIKLVFGADFPAAPPKGYFVTKIFHPNVSKTGEICVNTLKKDWEPKQGIKHVLLVIRCLLIVPNPASALNEEAGKLLLEHYDEFAKRARIFTSIHAKPKGGSSPTKAKGKDDTKDSKDPVKSKSLDAEMSSSSSSNMMSSSNSSSNSSSSSMSSSVSSSQKTGTKPAAKPAAAKKKALKRL